MNIEMTKDEQLRMQCLKLALEDNYGFGLTGVLETAQAFYDFIVNAADDKNTAVRRGVVVNINFEGD